MSRSHLPWWLRDEFEERFGRPVLERWSGIVRRAVYQLGGQDRYIPVAEIAAKIHIESAVIVYLVEKYLCAEILVTDITREDLDDGSTWRDPIETYFIRTRCTEPHVRVRPKVMRLTEDELLDAHKKNGRRRRRRR